MALCSAEAIILHQMDFKERDKLITFLTLLQGQKAGVLRGAKALHSPHLGQTEVFTHVQITYAEKPGRELVQIRKVEGFESFYPLRKDYQKFLFASYCLEWMRLYPIAEAEAPSFFQLLLQTLRRFSSSSALPAIKLEFEQHLLQRMGFFPHLEYCVICQKLLWQTVSPTRLPRLACLERHQLDCARGGIRCPACVALLPETVNLSPGTLAYWRATLPWQEVPLPLKPTLQNLQELDLAFLTYFRYAVGKIPNSHALLSLEPKREPSSVADASLPQG